MPQMVRVCISKELRPETVVDVVRKSSVGALPSTRLRTLIALTSTWRSPSLLPSESRHGVIGDNAKYQPAFVCTPRARRGPVETFTSMNSARSSAPSEVTDGKSVTGVGVPAHADAVADAAAPAARSARSFDARDASTHAQNSSTEGNGPTIVNSRNSSSGCNDSGRATPSVSQSAWRSALWSAGAGAWTTGVGCVAAGST